MTQSAREKRVVRELKEPCYCRVFCLEDTARTGRYCRLRGSRAALAAIKRKGSR